MAQAGMFTDILSKTSSSDAQHVLELGELIQTTTTASCRTPPNNNVNL